MSKVDLCDARAESLSQSGGKQTMSKLVLRWLRTEACEQLDNDVAANGTRPKFDAEMFDVGLSVENECMWSAGGRGLVRELGLRSDGLQNGTYLRAVGRRSRRSDAVPSLIDGVTAYGENAKHKKKRGSHGRRSSLVPKLHLGMPLSAKLGFVSGRPAEAVQLPGQVRSQVQLGNERKRRWLRRGATRRPLESVGRPLVQPVEDAHGTAGKQSHDSNGNKRPDKQGHQIGREFGTSLHRLGSWVRSLLPND